MKATGKYQLLDALSPEDYQALKADIKERGVMIPIELDEEGNVIDGHHRKMICEELGITDYPTVVRRGWTEEQKRTHSRRMNLARRHLTREQRRKLIEDELKEAPGATDRKIGKALGVDHKTVGSVRGRLETGGEIPQVDVRIGSNGMKYTRVPTRRSPTPEKGTIVDTEGNEVPDNLRKVFELTPEFVSIENMLMEVMRRMILLGEHSVPMREVDQVVRRRVVQLQDLLAASLPHRVHSSCGGRGCTDCRGLGYETGREASG